MAPEHLAAIWGLFATVLLDVHQGLVAFTPPELYAAEEMPQANMPELKGHMDDQPFESLAAGAGH